MSLIVIGSDKGAPGVSTAALALAAVWPRPVVVADADPAGSDLPMTLTDLGGNPQLKPEPGMLTLAMAVKRGGGAIDVRQSAQTIACGIAVLPGSVVAEQTSAYGGMWPQLLPSLKTPDLDVLVDVGSLRRDSPGVRLAAAADAVLLVTHATVAGLVRARERLTQLVGETSRQGGPTLGLVVVADAKAIHEAEKAAAATLHAAGISGVTVSGLAYDAKAVMALMTGPMTGKLQKSLLLRSASAAAVRTVAQLPQPTHEPVHTIVLPDRDRQSV